MAEEKAYIVRYTELHTVKMTGMTITEVAKAAEELVKSAGDGSKLLDIHVVPESA